jgi:hypothetical protein
MKNRPSTRPARARRRHGAAAPTVRAPAARPADTARDRSTDTERWLDGQLAGRPIPALVVVVGLGDGDLLDVLERRDRAVRVLALDPDPSTAGAFLQRPDRRRWMESGRLTCLAAPDYAGADEAWRLVPPALEEFILLVSPDLQADVQPATVNALQIVKRIVFGARANAEARRKFAPRYLTNSLRNAPAIAAGRDVRALADAYRAVPAVIVAAGPSLDRVIDDLRGVENHALLIAVDTALRPLLNAGVAPQLAVGLDPSETNARHFRQLPDCPRTWLVSESALDPSANRPFGDRTFWFRVGDHEPWPWYNQLGLDVGLLDVWGSVLTAAFQVAMLAGCDPIVVVGADLSHTDGRPYCRGTTYEFNWAALTAQGAGLTALWETGAAQAPRTRMLDLRGVETATTPVLLAFRDWMLAHAARSGRRVINATGAGMLFGAGVEQMSLAPALTGVREVPDIVTIALASPRGAPSLVLATPFQEMRAEIGDGRPGDVAARWAAFSGSGWDVASTIAALDEAALVLAGGEATGRPVRAHPATAHVFDCLPEGAARWRALLGGCEPLAGPAAQPRGDTPAETLLVEAVDLLLRITDTLRREGEDVAPVAAAEDVGRQPLSASFTWPASVAWDVDIFEAVLGVSSGALSLEESFFSGAVIPRESAGSTLAAPAQRESAPAGGFMPESASSASLACALLALEWALCVRSLPGSRAVDITPIRPLMRALAPRARLTERRIVETTELTLVAALDAGERSRTIELPVLVDERAMARLNTGIIHGGGSDTGGPAAAAVAVTLVASAGLPGRSASLSIRRGESPANHTDSAPKVLRITPRVLTDEGVPRSSIAYVISRGVVCVSAWATNSFVVRADGGIETAHSWPNPILNELPLGVDGVVAWSNGGIDCARSESGSVMYRLGKDAPTTVERLPFKPRWGTWWRNRLYWTCFESGIGSWAPGAGSAAALPDLTLLAVAVHDEELLLSLCIRSADGILQRRRGTHAWLWNGEQPPRVTSLGPLGVASSRSVAQDDWVATAYPEADIVQIESGDGRVLSMTCYHPFKVAWLERSLLVSTLSGEILLFQDLLHRSTVGG